MNSAGGGQMIPRCKMRTYHGSLHNAGIDCSKTKNYSKMSGDVFSVSEVAHIPVVDLVRKIPTADLL